MQGHLQLVQQSCPGTLPGAARHAAVNVPARRFVQGRGGNVRQGRETHIPAIDHRCLQLHAVPGKNFLGTRGQHQGIMLIQGKTGFIHQDQAAVVGDEMHRIGAHPDARGRLTFVGQAADGANGKIPALFSLQVKQHGKRVTETERHQLLARGAGQEFFQDGDLRLVPLPHIPRRTEQTGDEEGETVHKQYLVSGISQIEKL